MRRKKNKNVAGLLALFFGWVGAHKFYLGKNEQGWTFAALWGAAMWLRIPVIGHLLRFLWVPAVILIGIIEAVRLFVMDDRRFDEKYNGIPFEYEEQRAKSERPNASSAPPKREQKRYAKKASARHNPYKKSGKEKFADYDYAGAIEDFKKSVELAPADVASHFNLACAYSLTEEVKLSFRHLQLAVAQGFRGFKKIQEHPALAYLRIQPAFDAFVKNGYRMPRTKEADKVATANDLLASQPDLLDQLNKLVELKKKGDLSEEEFEKRKQILVQEVR